MSLVEQREAPALAAHTVILFENHRDPVPNNEQNQVGKKPRFVYQSFRTELFR